MPVSSMVQFLVSLYVLSEIIRILTIVQQVPVKLLNYAYMCLTYKFLGKFYIYLIRIKSKMLTKCQQFVSNKSAKFNFAEELLTIC